MLPITRARSCDHLANASTVGHVTVSAKCISYVIIILCMRVYGYGCVCVSSRLLLWSDCVRGCLLQGPAILQRASSINGDFPAPPPHTTPQLGRKNKTSKSFSVSRPWLGDLVTGQVLTYSVTSPPLTDFAFELKICRTVG